MRRTLLPSLLLGALACASGDQVGPRSPEESPIDKAVGGGGEAVTKVISCLVPLPPLAGSVNLATDVTYTTVAGMAQKLDIAWPKTAGTYPLVFLIHGGGWSAGDKTDLRSTMLTFAGMGFTAVSVNYRLVKSAGNRFPAAMQDLRCALRWLRSRAGTYRLNPNRVAAVGISAGGHLAEMLGLGSNVSGLDGTCSVTGNLATVTAVVAFAGPSDLRKSSYFTSMSLPSVTGLLGGKPESFPTTARLASPLAHVTAGDPPVLLVHGSQDPVVPPLHSSRLNSTLHSAGDRATLVTLSGVGHNLQVFSTASSMMPGSCTTMAFLNQELR
jgi:acetyl esterase/lipase